jgi:Fe-S-cluster containining protein
MNEVKSFNNIPNIRIVNNKKVFNCTQCGECCHIREKDKNISDKEEADYRQYMFTNFGIIYLAKLSDITINVWPEEAEALKKEAKDKKINIKILPKRAVYDSKNHELTILDYYIDHDVCPFFDAKNRLCGVYMHRPIICRSYPLLTTKNLGKCEYKLSNPNDYADEKFEAEKLEKMVNLQKSILKDLVDKGEIVIPESISVDEMENIITTAKFKELRIMDKI